MTTNSVAANSLLSQSHTHRLHTSTLITSESYLELLQLLLNHLHLCANQALRIQILFCSSQQALQLSHQPVEITNTVRSILDLVQPGLAAFTQLESRKHKSRMLLTFTKAATSQDNLHHISVLFTHLAGLAAQSLRLPPECEEVGRGAFAPQHGGTL